MRRENRTANETRTSANLQGYHGARTCENSHINYAFRGFKCNRYFTSDRTIKCDENFNRLDGKPLKGYGLEIETGFTLARSTNDTQAQTVLSNIMENTVFPIFPADLFKQQMDSTITGTECITQVMTKEFIRNNYKNFKTMYNDFFPMFGVNCADGRCGMHVNVSVGLLGTTAKIQEDSARKLFYIINKHYNFFKVAFARTGSTNWCGQMRYENARTMNVHCMDGSHGNCFNGSHFDEGRVEIRLVGGQKNYACFRNTMETIFHLIGRLKDLSWKQCDDLVAIFSGCNQYVFDRINTKCKDAGTISADACAQIESTIIREELL